MPLNALTRADTSVQATFSNKPLRAHPSLQMCSREGERSGTRGQYDRLVAKAFRTLQVMYPGKKARRPSQTVGLRTEHRIDFAPFVDAEFCGRVLTVRVALLTGAAVGRSASLPSEVRGWRLA